MYYSKGVWAANGQEEEDDRVSRRIDLAQREVDRDENVNGRRGTLRNQRRRPERPPAPGPLSGINAQVTYAPPNSGISLSAFNGESSAFQPVPPSRRDRSEKRLEHLNRAQDELKQRTARAPKRNVLGIYVLDISHALDETPYVTWLPCKNQEAPSDGPEETILYTLVEGNSELIMFGGIQKDPSSLACTTNLSNQVSNSLHFITAPKYII